MVTRMPVLLQKFFPSRIWKGPADGKRVYLTFDDGPIPEVTPWVLAVLEQYQARASFFCIGDNVRKHPEVFQQIIQAGHTIGNHGFHHLKGWGCDKETYIKDVLLAQQEFLKHQALRSHSRRGIYFRPPYGKMTTAQAKGIQNEGFTIVMWDILSLDYQTNLNLSKVSARIMKNITPGSIIVFHDSLKAEQNLKILLPRVLEYCCKEGYSFECL